MALRCCLHVPALTAQSRTVRGIDAAGFVYLPHVLQDPDAEAREPLRVHSILHLSKVP